MTREASWSRTTQEHLAMWLTWHKTSYLVWTFYCQKTYTTKVSLKKWEAFWMYTYLLRRYLLYNHIRLENSTSVTIQCQSNQTNKLKLEVKQEKKTCKSLITMSIKLDFKLHEFWVTALFILRNGRGHLVVTVTNFLLIEIKKKINKAIKSRSFTTM